MEDFRRIFLPYCLMRLEDGRYIVLNRLYKPLGISSSEWIEYESHPSAIRIDGLTPAKIGKLSHKAIADFNAIHLYGDGCIPTDSAEHWESYSQKLKLLANLGVSVK